MKSKSKFNWNLLWSIPILMVLFLLYKGTYEPNFTCQRNQQLAAWAKFDKAARKIAFEYRKSTSAAYYAQSYMSLVETREKELHACHCELERPKMDERDVELAKSKLHKLEEYMLINTALSYDKNLRAVDSTGKAHNWVFNGRTAISSPVFLTLSQEGIRSLKGENDGTFSQLVARTGDFGLQDAYIPLMEYDGPEFMNELQRLHDDARFWDAGGLSNEGSEEVEAISKKFGLNTENILSAIKSANP